ncbi:MAG: acyl-CoA desaturase [Planctomycetes bacterium]|nr:acyl-CoA desaturase [Planctomycetota bacterium]
MAQVQANEAAPHAGPADQHGSMGHLPLPSTVQKRQILWPYLISLLTIHALALLAFIPWLFSWTGVALAVCGLYLFGTLGINLCYHRLLTHRSFACPLWLERFFATIGVCCLQDTPGRWVAIHRFHHQHSDEQEDPHSPLVTFFWGHMGWLLVKNERLNSVATYERYARDVLRDPFYFRLEKHLLWAWVYLAHAVLFYMIGFAIGWAWNGEYMEGVQFGLSLLVWGVFVRTVAVWHITWSVNSVTHMWGYQNYPTGENSRNNFFVGLVSNGEGWHNNHHADQRSAAHGHRWFEFDVTYITIWILQKIGLAWDVIKPSPRLHLHEKPATLGDAIGEP